MENPYDSDPDHTAYEIFDQWEKSELIRYILNNMTEKEKIEWIRI